jgi:hypothetical protein
MTSTTPIQRCRTAAGKFSKHGAIDRLRRVVVALLDRRGLQRGGAPGQHAREHGEQ